MFNGLGSAWSMGLSALNAFGNKGMNAISHNIANVSTAGFDPIKVNYESRANNMGVSAKSVIDSSIKGNENSNNNGLNILPPEALDPSGTDLSRSFAEMISTENAFEANAATIRTWDSMLGSIIDMKV